MRPKPGCSGAMTRWSALSASSSGDQVSPSAPCRKRTAGPSPASRYRSFVPAISIVFSIGRAFMRRTLAKSGRVRHGATPMRALLPAHARGRYRDGVRERCAPTCCGANRAVPTREPSDDARRTRCQRGSHWVAIAPAPPAMWACGGRQGRAGRLHAAAWHHQRGQQPVHLPQPVVRHRPRPRSDRADLQDAGRVRGPSVDRDQDDCRSDRPRQSQSRQAQLRLARARHRRAHHGRTPAIHRGLQDHARSVQGLVADDRRLAGRTNRTRRRSVSDADPTAQGQQV